MIKVTKAEFKRYMQLNDILINPDNIQFHSGLTNSQWEEFEILGQKLKAIEEYNSGENKLKYIDNDAIYLVCSVISDRSMSVDEIMELMNITISELEITLGIELDYENFRVSRGWF